MHIKRMPSTGPLSMGFRLRTEAMKAIGSTQIAAKSTPGGKVDRANDLHKFFLDCATLLHPLMTGEEPGHGPGTPGSPEYTLKVTGGFLAIVDEDNTASGQLVWTASEGLDSSTPFISASATGSGTFSLSPTGAWSFVPDPDWHGVGILYATIKDAEGHTLDFQIFAVVNPVADTAPQALVTTKNTPVLFGVHEPGAWDGDNPEIVSYTQPAYGVLTPGGNPGGLPGFLLFTPDEDRLGTDAFTVTVKTDTGVPEIIVFSIYVYEKEIEAPVDPETPVSYWYTPNGPSGQYFEDTRLSGSRPAWINGDTLWSGAVMPTRAQLKDYLDIRQAQGFNALIVTAVEHTYSNTTPPWKNREGFDPFVEMGVPHPDWDSPIEDYWEFVDFLFEECEERNMLVLLAPMYSGYKGGYGEYPDGWNQEIKDTPVSVLKDYGRFIGERYGRRPNAVLVVGNDYAVDQGTDKEHYQAFVEGVLEKAPNVPRTAHGEPRQNSSDVWPGVTNWTTLDSVYSRDDTLEQCYEQCLRAWNQSPSRPVVFFEGRYEKVGEPARVLRNRAQMWVSFAGGCKGHFYGNSDIWHGGYNDPSGFQGIINNKMNSTGVDDVGHLVALLPKIDWHFFRPTPELITSGINSGNAYRAAALSGFGMTAIVYVPEDTGTLTIDLSKLNYESYVRGWWYDPTDGSFILATPGTNPSASGTQVFTHPGSNADGEDDWVLVLQSVPTDDDTGLGGGSPPEPEPEPEPDERVPAASLIVDTCLFCAGDLSSNTAIGDVLDDGNLFAVALQGYTGSSEPFPTITKVEFGSSGNWQEMVLIRQGAGAWRDAQYAGIWYLLNPSDAGASNAIRVTTGNTFTQGVSGEWIVLKGIDEDTPVIDSKVGASVESNTITLSLAGGEAGDILWIAAGSDSDTSVSTSLNRNGQTVLKSQNSVACRQYYHAQAYKDVSGGRSAEISGYYSSGSAVIFKQGATGGVAPPDPGDDQGFVAEAWAQMRNDSWAGDEDAPGSFALAEDAGLGMKDNVYYRTRAGLVMGRYPDARAWSATNPDYRELSWMNQTNQNTLRNLTWNKVMFWSLMYLTQTYGKNHTTGWVNNTRVRSWDHQLWVKKASTGVWVPIIQSDNLGGEVWWPNWAALAGPPKFDIRTEADGARSIRLVHDPAVAREGYWMAHCYPTGSRVFDWTDVEDVLTCQKVALIKHDPNGVDDRDKSRFLFGIGADYYPLQTNPLSYYPGVGTSAMRIVTAKYPDWQWSIFHTMTKSRFEGLNGYPEAWRDWR